MPSSAQRSSLNTESKLQDLSKAPAMQLKTSSVTQVPIFSLHDISLSVGDEPLYFTSMRDGTFAYIKESLLQQGMSIVKI